MTHLIISAVCYGLLSYLALSVAIFIIIEVRELRYTDRNKGRRR